MLLFWSHDTVSRNPGNCTSDPLSDAAFFLFVHSKGRREGGLKEVGSVAEGPKGWGCDGDGGVLLTSM